MSNTTLLSIVMPTRNRQKYALEVVKNILLFNKAEVEIVIEDNSDDECLRLMLGDLINDNRVKYRYNKKRVSFVENFNNAISSSTGEYIVIVGDDDGVLPEIVDVVYWAKRNDIETIQYNRSYSYVWPTEEGSGKLTLRGFRFNRRCIDTNKELKKMVISGDFYYTKYKLMNIYHGIVKRKWLEKIKEITGAYINGLTPDIYASVSLSLLINKYCYLDYPLTFNGVCRQSGTAQAIRGEHTGNDIYRAPHFIGQDRYEWDQRFPKVYTVSTIWGETAIKALNDIDQSGTFEKMINFKRVYKNINLRHPEFYQQIFDCAKHNNSSFSKGYFSRFIWFLAKRSEKILIYSLRLVKYLFYGRQIKENVNSTTEALSTIEKVRNYRKNRRKLYRFLDDERSRKC
ncbi:glycosyltransferase involved in cell wall biosynthesis [Acholeplasma morum]|uniref:glycosyltransferase n=1 Tax=Paracholeplasma morum TaxID=264637 RepID=UPI0019584847|nr:glycosyltransferase [Paracholeplasma morum]MBM7453028.1 glycosyltransferase involved in cell wall biosynthesis [Paracholeplasma morum]